jgi:hypothetical protein
MLFVEKAENDADQQIAYEHGNQVHQRLLRVGEGRLPSRGR